MTRTPIPVGIGLIRRDGCFLVRQRPDGTVYAGYWEFPGGKCEPGEAPGAGRRRANASRRPACASWSGRCRRTTMHRYPHGLVELHLPRLHAPRTQRAEPLAGTGFRWVPAGELGALRFPEANEAVLEELLRRS